ncbi:hypothetical protein GS942_21390 [Rhodococcus hoagii]|nr:hypothetical protein [Prescottella equi]
MKAGATIKTLHPERAEAARRGSSSIVFEAARNDTARSVTAHRRGTHHQLGPTRRTSATDMLRGIEDEPRARDIYSENFAHGAGDRDDDPRRQTASGSATRLTAWSVTTD